jgi:hypothetical protein
MLRMQSEHESSSSDEHDDTAMSDVLDIFPPQEIALYLLSIVNQHATDSFFYFDQHNMHRRLVSFYARQPRRTSPAFACLALSTFALGVHWAHLDDRGIESHQHSNTAADVFAAKAQSLIPKILLFSATDTASACLVLSLYLLTTSPADSAYIYMGFALRVAIAANLHKEGSQSEFSNIECESRHRLWWTIYTLDR